MTTATDLIERINAAEQRIKIDRFEIAEAERQLEALCRNPGVEVSSSLLASVLPETRARVAPRLNLTGRFSYLGRT